MFTAVVAHSVSLESRLRILGHTVGVRRNVTFGGVE